MQRSGFSCDQIWQVRGSNPITVLIFSVPCLFEFARATLVYIIFLFGFVSSLILIFKIECLYYEKLLASMSQVTAFVFLNFMHLAKTYCYSGHFYIFCLYYFHYHDNNCYYCYGRYNYQFYSFIQAVPIKMFLTSTSYSC